MDFTKIMDIIKQLIDLIKDSDIIDKIREVAPTLIEKGIEFIKGFAA